MSLSKYAFGKLAVVGAGSMGGGIAQTMAAEGFPVVLVDLDEEKVQRGVESVKNALFEGVERKIFRPEQAKAILGRIRGTTDWDDLADADLVVEAVFEEMDVKRRVFQRLEGVCRADAILATNTSSFAITELAEATQSPGRVVGLHHFYHPAKNRLVEVVPGRATEPDVTRAAWALQERLGKTPISSSDSHGFIVNRYFVPWLNAAVRLLEEEIADLPTIEAASKRAFGVGMGPFELMNVTGVPIALHAARTLGETFGPLYAPADRLEQQVAAGKPWPLGGTVDAGKFAAVADRMLAVVFYVAGALVDDEVGTIEDTDIGARVGLRWPEGPFELMNTHGVRRSGDLLDEIARRWELTAPRVLKTQIRRGEPFVFELVRSDLRNGIATLTINRPDALNALNETVIAQLHAALNEAAGDEAIRGIVIAGAGKAFVAGADVSFFVENIDAGDLDRIVSFTRAGHELLADVAGCPKPVVARLDGPALGGGLELALACHRIIASPKATLGVPETGIGIYPGLGGTQRLPRRIGPGLAKYLVYTGQVLRADQAYEIGLIDRVVRPEGLDDAIRDAIVSEEEITSPTWPVAYAELERFFNANPVEEIRLGKADASGREPLVKAMKRVAIKAPHALRLAERLIDDGSKGDLEAGLQMELDHVVEIFSTEDAYEGLSSVGKRKPAFKGQ